MNTVQIDRFNEMGGFPPFEIESDLEFYCYLKTKLPAEYSISAEPSKAYYSEWAFRYVIQRRGDTIAEVAGDYREIKPGFLVEKAAQFLCDLA